MTQREMLESCFEDIAPGMAATGAEIVDLIVKIAREEARKAVQQAKEEQWGRFEITGQIGLGDYDGSSISD